MKLLHKSIGLQCRQKYVPLSFGDVVLIRTSNVDERVTVFEINDNARSKMIKRNEVFLVYVGVKMSDTIFFSDVVFVDIETSKLVVVPGIQLSAGDPLLTSWTLCRDEFNLMIEIERL